MLLNFRTITAAALCCLLAVTLGFADSKNGEAKFKVGGKETVKVSLGDKLKFEGEFRVTDFFGKTALNAGGKLKNTSDKKMHYAYYVTFLDKDKNVVGCTSLTSLSVEAGKDTFIGNVIFIPADRVEKIVSFAATLYEGEKEIGSNK
jgi:hypothetical protein